MHIIDLKWFGALWYGRERSLDFLTLPATTLAELTLQPLSDSAALMLVLRPHCFLAGVPSSHVKVRSSLPPVREGKL